MCDDTCRGCGVLLPEHDDSHRGRCRIWCSKACSARADRQLKLKAKAPGKCANCAATFLTHLSTRKYCSITCGEIARGTRRGQPLSQVVCALPGCNATFTPIYDKQRCCCEQHGKNLWNRESRAAGGQKLEWTDKRRDHYHRRRALKKKASTGEPVRMAAIAERDGHKCGICKLRVPDVKWPHPLSPSLDHMIPLTKGGSHDPSNVQLAHLRCNTAKGNRGGGEQLFLIG